MTVIDQIFELFESRGDEALESLSPVDEGPDQEGDKKRQYPEQVEVFRAGEEHHLITPVHKNGSEYRPSGAGGT